MVATKLHLIGHGRRALTAVAETNVALASAGATLSASSTYSTDYPLSSINDNARTGAVWAAGGGWIDATPNQFPDYVEIVFSGSKTINRVVVYTVQDNFQSPIEPTDSMTFSLYGVTSFDVLGWNGSTYVTLAAVTGNNLVKRTVTFTPFDTDRIRISVKGAADGVWSRLTEVEAWGVPSAVVLPPPQTLGATNVRTNTFYAGVAGIQAAFNTAATGDTITAVPGLYVMTGNYGIPRSLTFKSSVVGSKVRLQCIQNGNIQGSGIVMSAPPGSSIVVEDIEIFGNRANFGNNGGLYNDGDGQAVTVRRCLFHDCNNGIIVGQNPTSSYVIEDSEFYNCGADEFAHGIYIGEIASLQLRGCYFHNYISVGHLVKCRARVALLEGNRLTMEQGNCNRVIDCPNGGDVTIRGNLLEMNTGNTQNYPYGQFLSFGVEESFDPAHWTVHKFTVVQNTFVNHSTPEKKIAKVEMGSVMTGGIQQYIIKDNVFGAVDRVVVDATPASYIQQLNNGAGVATTGTYEVSTTDNTFISLANLNAAVPNHATFDFTLTAPVAGSQSWAPFQYLHPTTHVARSDTYRGGLIVAAAGSWGTSFQTGTFSADVWTPGKDSNGVVNQVSYNLVPFNRWIEVVGTRLDSLQSAVTAPGAVDPHGVSLAGWADRGTSGWNGVTNAWNGMAWDTRTGFERGWLVVAGGHADSSNDGIYKLDVRKMAWGVQRMPTNNSWWVSTYNSSWGGGFKMYPPAATYYNGNNVNPEGVYWDEFYDQADSAHSYRTPTARHMYGSAVYVPTLGASGKILMGCLRYWEYDLATDSWALPKFPFGNAAGYDGSKGYAGENMNGFWDAIGQKYFCCATQNASAGQTWACSPGGTNFVWWGGYPIGGYESQTCAMEQLGNHLWTLIYHADVAANGKPYYMRHQQLNPYVTPDDHTVTIGSSLAGVTWTGFWDGQSMTFIPELNKWLCNIHTTGSGMQWCLLDATIWVLELATFPGNPFNYITTTYGSIENKLKYLPDIHALVHVLTADQNMRLIRFA